MEGGTRVHHVRRALLPLLFCLSICFLHVESQIAIIKAWNGAVSDGSKAVIAVRTAGDIDHCTWTKVSGRKGGSNRDVLVFSTDSDNRVGTVRIEEDRHLCKLTIDSASLADHAGEWEATVYGICAGDRPRGKRQADTPPAAAVPGSPPVPASPLLPTGSFDTAGKPVAAHAGGVQNILNPGKSTTGLKGKHMRTDEIRERFQTTKKVGDRLTSDCSEQAKKRGVLLEIGEASTLVAVAAQEDVIGMKGQEVILSARTNSQPSNCVVEFGSGGAKSVVELKGGRDNCNSNFVRSSKVCVETYESRPDGIFACNARVEKMTEDLDGKWTIRVERNDRRSLDETVDFDLATAEWPTGLKLTSNGRELRGRDNIETGGRGNKFEVECSGSGRDAKPDLKLYAGNKLIPADESDCTDGDYCVRFTFPPTKQIDGEDLSCVAHIQNVDSFADKRTKVSAGSFRIDKFAASLTNAVGDDVKICALNKKRGDSLDVEIEFESDPEPDFVEWRMQQVVGVSRTFEAGDVDTHYASYAIEKSAGRNIYVASLAIDFLEDDDLNVPNNHKLVVRNDLGEVSFNITFVTRDCTEGRQSTVGNGGNRGSSSQNNYKCDLSNIDCRCDSARSSRRCCDASSGCTRNCCRACSSSDSTRVCNMCDDVGGKCLKVEDSGRQSDYQCQLLDSNCRCDSSQSSRRCCDASPGCNSRDCCRACTASDSSRLCNLCDNAGNQCMKVDDSGTSLTPSNVYQCELTDRDCRCDSSGRNRLCCDASPRCSFGNCCSACDSQGDSRNCNLCDNAGQQCLMLNTGTSISGFRCELTTDSDCRCDSARRQRTCCDASPRCRNHCCLSCGSTDLTNGCNLCDNAGQHCMLLDDGGSSLSTTDYQCNLVDSNCRCDSGGRRKICCDASPRCRRNCCTSCRSSDSTRICNLCDNSGQQCMKSEDSSTSLVTTHNNYQCELADRNCRCDSRGNSRICCDTSPSCRRDCCLPCSSSDSSRICNVCDDVGSQCMKIDDGVGTTAGVTTGNNYLCELSDINCRCDSRRFTRQCCDASPRCRRNCCATCSSSDTARKCNLCDDSGIHCMRPDNNNNNDGTSGLSIGGDYQCRLNDRDCRCDSKGSSRICCDASSSCRINCCVSCRSSDSSRICNLCDDSSSQCMKFEDETTGLSNNANYQCRLSDRDCRCDTSSSNRRCCDAAPSCRRDCCSRCSTSDSSRICNLCDSSGQQCMKPENDSPLLDSQCSPSDRACICFGDFCCSNDRDCRGSNCCTVCKEGDRGCQCRSQGQECFVVTIQGGSDNNVAARAKKLLLDSCLKMSATLLDYWEPTGNRRPTSSQSDNRQVQQDLQDFFTTAKCTNFDRDIQDYVKDGGRVRSPLRNPPVGTKFETMFTSILNPGNSPNKVEKVDQATRPDPELVKAAQDILQQGQDLSATSENNGTAIEHGNRTAEEGQGVPVGAPGGANKVDEVGGANKDVSAATRK